MDAFIDFLISWGPYVIILFLLFWFLKRSGQMNYKEYVKTSFSLTNEIIEQTKLLNKKLDKILEHIESTKNHK
jgi:CHASE1-domain containing sensor protein